MANELTVVTKEIVAPVVGNANEEYFESLNSIIDKIGEHSGEVEFEVREEAIKYIDEFENIIIRRINHKVDALSDVNHFFNNGSVRSFDIDYVKNNTKNEMIMNIFDRFKVEGQKNIGDILEDIEEYEDWVEDNKPEPLEYDEETTTPAAAAQLILNHKLEQAKFKSESNSKKYVIRKDFNTLLRAMGKMKEFKSFKRELEKQIKQVKDMKAVASEKASLARLNMAIPNADIREALRELSAFQKNL